MCMQVYLQREIEVFIADVFLRLLQSSHISFDQRVSVLHVFRSLCQDPWGMLELFINYDMATDRADVFQKVLSILASIARGSGMPADPAGRAPHESAALKQLALQGIVTLTRSLSIIVDQSYVSPLTALSVTPSTADVDAELAQAAEDVPEDMSVAGQTAAGAPASTLVEDYDHRVLCFYRFFMFVRCCWWGFSLELHAIRAPHPLQPYRRFERFPACFCFPSKIMSY
jgi:hypothetical protein